MSMQDIPREQPGSERAAQSNQRRHTDSHRVRTGYQQACQRAHDQARDEQDDEMRQWPHAGIVAAAPVDSNSVTEHGEQAFGRAAPRLGLPVLSLADATLHRYAATEYYSWGDRETLGWVGIRAYRPSGGRG